jgi:hypothetical protein
VPSSRSHPFGDLAADAPHLAALVEHLGDLQPAAKVTHHPLAYLAGGQESWRRETLRVLDRAVEIVHPVLHQTDRLRRFSSRLRDGQQFTPAIAELVAGARIARLTDAMNTMLIDPPDGRPDVVFDLGGRRAYGEVYAPKSWRQLDLIDDVRERMSSQPSSCRFHLVFTRPTSRNSNHAKSIADNLRRLAEQIVAADAQVATFSAAKLDAEWTVHVGSAQGAPADHELIGWAHRDDHGPSTSVLGSIDARYVSAEEEARDAMSRLGQLVEGAPNLLIVDLSGRPMDAFTLSRYEEIATSVGASHPRLSAVLLTGRTCRLRPSPSTDFEACAWYRVIPNVAGSAPFSRAELELLGQPGLVVPGRGGSS